ncbi:MAG: HypC/HybG/HupF family hydrogenase formation chaperone [Zavarzinia sp.]|nr:HypC/HybG/HupF family hydrogenase formation chaperone [Zavarzinia sp.]
MCIATPMRLDAVQGIRGLAAGAAVDLTLVPDAAAGDWVLVFLGAARRRLDEEEAGRILAALEGLAAAMRGEAADLDQLFADLADREPTLPPHLEAARAAGLKDA